MGTRFELTNECGLLGRGRERIARYLADIGNIFACLSGILLSYIVSSSEIDYQFSTGFLKSVIALELLSFEPPLKSFGTKKKSPTIRGLPRHACFIQRKN